MLWSSSLKPHSHCKCHPLHQIIPANSFKCSICFVAYTAFHAHMSIVDACLPAGLRSVATTISAVLTSIAALILATVATLLSAISALLLGTAVALVWWRRIVALALAVGRWRILVVTSLLASISSLIWWRCVGLVVGRVRRVLTLLWSTISALAAILTLRWPLIVTLISTIARTVMLSLAVLLAAIALSAWIWRLTIVLATLAAVLALRRALVVVALTMRGRPM